MSSTTKKFHGKGGCPNRREANVVETCEAECVACAGKGSAWAGGGSEVANGHTVPGVYSRRVSDRNGMNLSGSGGGDCLVSPSKAAAPTKVGVSYGRGESGGGDGSDGGCVRGGGAGVSRESTSARREGGGACRLGSSGRGGISFDGRVPCLSGSDGGASSVDEYGGVVGCDDGFDLTFMNVSEDENEGSALDISMDSSIDMSPCSTPSSMSPVASWDETALPSVANGETERRAWVRVRKVKVESSIEECDWRMLQVEKVQAEQVEVAEEVSGSVMVVNGEVELRAWERVMKVKVELARSEAVDWRMLQVGEDQAEEIEVGNVTRVAEPTVVVSVPNPTFDCAKRVLCEYDLTRQSLSVGDVLHDMVVIVEVVDELVDEVVKGVFDEDMERLVGVGDVLRDLCNVVGYEVEKEQLTGAYEVLEDVCGRVEIEVDVEEVTRELVNDVVDRIEDDERVFSEWLTNVPVDRVCDTWKRGDVIKPVNEEQRAVLKRLREVYAGSEIKHIPSLKNKERKLVNAELSLVDGLMHNVVTKDDITEIQRLLYAGVYVTVERLGMMKDRKGGKRKVDKDPWWKRRIEASIKKWRKDLGLVDAYKRGNLKNVEERARLELTYRLGAKGYLYVIAFLKGKIHSGTCKIQSYLKRELQYRQNTLFKNDQKQLYKELGGTSQTDTAAAPDAKEATDFWSGIWSNPVEHNRNAEWLERAKRVNARIEKQDDVVIELDDVRRGIRRMTNWKAPGPDAVQGFWFKKFSSMHVRIASGLQGCLAQGWVPKWMTLGRTSLFMKDPAKGRRADNYRPIACLPLMWKLLTGILSEKIYCHLDGNNLLPDEQKGCRKRSRGTKDQLLIDKMILKDAKVGKNLSMAWIDYKKAYDMVPHSWIKEVVDLLGVAGNIGGLLSSSMSGWRTQLMGGTEVLGTVDIKRGIFQGDSLSPLLFVMIMIPLSQQLNAANKGYKLKNTDRSISHLLFMDDLKLYAGGRNAKSQLEELVNVVKGYSDDIRMEFGMSKCAVLSVERGKRVEEVGLELPSGEVMADVEEEGYKYLGVLQTDTFMSAEMKKKVKKEYFRRLKLLLKSQLYAGNLIAGINAWAIGIVRYTAGVLDWGKVELRKIDVQTRKMMTMHGAFHRNSNVDRLYLKRKDGGRGLISVLDCVRLEEENLLKYVTDSSEWMLQKVLEHGIVKGNAQADYKKAKEHERKESLLAKPLHGRFFRTTKEDEHGEVIAGPRSWEWVRSGYMTKSTEAYIFAAQEQALGTRAVRSKIYREKDDEGEIISGLCRVCGGKTETVAHIAGGCGQLMKGPGTVRHDRMGARVHWELCKKYNVKVVDRWYEHKPQTTSRSEDGNVIIHWDVPWTTPPKAKIWYYRPDVVIQNVKDKFWTIIDFSVPLDHNIVTKQAWKVEKYHKLAQYFRTEHGVQTTIIPVVVGAFGSIPVRLPLYLKELGIPDVVGGLQKTALLGTQRILKNVLSL